ncbi:hypothetical protein MLD38_006013 [Melastoma candidum]|uniref:Uncharacterized protein n=1 Tax=Melastoma candidum TaxID=119954 RepID=A0ACB9RQ92_9MYRT|nr:hypothetical protein MLD38_006013 [Melastoma candidum]
MDSTLPPSKRTTTTTPEMGDPSPKQQPPPTQHQAVVDGGTGDEAQVKRLRDRWELASVLNFLSVFEPVIGTGLMPEGLIERELINPTSSLAQLHIKLLKGIPPRSKMLDGSDAWVTVLCKKLIPWWPWVADGVMPLKPANGEELRHYKELGPFTRLLILKALCELRSHQDDAVRYINASLKTGTPVSHFRKEKLIGDGGTSYWYDDSVIGGHRLYREVHEAQPKAKNLGEDLVSLPAMSFLWETLATTPDEFRRVADIFAHKESMTEVAVSNILQSDVLPVLEKLQKDKERMLKRKGRKEMLLRNCIQSYVVRSVRSSRIRRPASYTFDDYDQAIDDAIRITETEQTGEGNNKDDDRRWRLELESSGRENAEEASPSIPVRDLVVPDSEDEN